MMNKISQQKTYSELKKLIAQKKGRRYREIVANQELCGKFLGFTSAGLKSFTVDLKDTFGVYGIKLSMDEVKKAKKVRDLAKLIWTSIPEDNKKRKSER